MLVTRVGGLPDLVPHAQSGWVTDAEPTSIADVILELYQHGTDYFIPHLRRIKQELSWTVLTDKLIALAHGISK